MRNILFTLLLMLLGLPVLGQSVGPTRSVVIVTSDPNGACVASDSPELNSTNGHLYTCVNLVWTLQAGGGAGVSSVGMTVPPWLSVAGSPITSTGTLAVTAPSGQTANQILATPSGSTGALGLRALTILDLPTSIPFANMAINAANVVSTFSGTCNSGTYLRGDGSCQSPPGNGTVTNVAATSTPAWLTITGSPITGAGTFNFDSTGGLSPNQVLATPNGITGKLATRSLVSADIPVIPLATGVSGNLSPNNLNSGTGADATHAWFGDGTWKVPSVGSAAFSAVTTGTNISAAMICSTGCSLAPGGAGSVTANAYTGNLNIINFNSATGAGATTAWFGDGTWKTAVTSIGLSVPAWLSVASSPITTSGTIALTAATGQTANQVLATPNGSTGALAPRALVAADLPQIPVTLLNSGSGANGTSFWRGDGTWAIPATDLSLANYASLSAAVAAIGGSQVTLKVTGSNAVAASMSVPANITLNFSNGGSLNPASSQTLTIVGSVQAGDSQIFGGAGTVVFTGNAIISEVNARWFGATGDGSTDDTVTLQAALVAATTASVRPAFRFPPGTYRVCNLFLGNSAATGCPTTQECPAPSRVFSSGSDSILHAVLKATSACGGTAGDFVIKANSMSSFTLENLAINGNATSTAGTGASCLDVSYQKGTAPSTKSVYRNLDIASCRDAAGKYALDADQVNDAAFENISIGITSGATATGNMTAFSMLAGGGQAGEISGLKVSGQAGAVQMDVQSGQISDSNLSGGLVLGFGGSSGTVSRNLIVLNNVKVGLNPATSIVINGLKSTGSTSSIQSLVCNSCNLGSTGDLSGTQAIFGGYFTAGVTMNGGETHAGTGLYFGSTIASGTASKPLFSFLGTMLNTALPASGAVVDVKVSGAFNGASSTIAETSSKQLNLTGGMAVTSGIVDLTAAATLPLQKGTFAAKPGTCTQGQLYFATDLTAGQQILECSSTNTWTQQVSASGSLGTGGLTLSLANAGTTGTTVNKLVKYTGAPSTGVIMSTTDTSGAIGIVSGGAGTTSSATIVVVGNASCVFDNGTKAGDFVQISITTAGDCHDYGPSYPPAGQVIGRVLSTNGSAGTYAMQVLVDGSAPILNTLSATPPYESGSVTLAAGTGTYTYKKSYMNIPKCTGTDTTGTNAVKLSGATSTQVTVTGTSTDVINVTCADVATVSYYVDPINGSDNWSGTIPAVNIAATDGPWATLAKAHTALQSGSIKAVRLRAGIYTLSADLAFVFNDSNETWMNYPGETPIIDGGGSHTLSFTGLGGPLAFYGLTFQNLASGGISYNTNVAVTFRWNTWNNCNTNCLSGGGVASQFFDSNVLYGGSGSSDTSLKWWFGSHDNKVSHNYFFNHNHGAVQFASGATDPSIANNVVDRNICINTNLSDFDNGALYMTDQHHTGTGNVITNNIIYNVGNGATGNALRAIYLDDFMSNVTVSGNICSICGTTAWQLHGGNNNNITNNIWDLSNGIQAGFYQSSGLGTIGMTGNTLSKNIYYSATTFAATLYTDSRTGGDAAMSSNANNLYFSANSSSIPNTTIVDTNPTTANPQFANASAKQWIMPSGSPAFSSPVSMSVIPVDQGPLPYNAY